MHEISIISTVLVKVEKRLLEVFCFLNVLSVRVLRRVLETRFPEFERGSDDRLSMIKLFPQLSGGTLQVGHK